MSIRLTRNIFFYKFVEKVFMSSKKVSKVSQYSISYFIFFTNFIILLFSLGLMLFNNYNFIINTVILLTNIIFNIPLFLSYKYQKILISERKIYIKNKFMKTEIVLDLVQDLNYFNCKLEFFGTMFNY